MLVDEMTLVVAELRERFEREKGQVEAYVAHLEGGGDPTQFKTPYDGGVRGHAQRLFNAYREEAGKMPIPASPLSNHNPYVYRLLAFMADRPGEWIAVSELKKMSGYSSPSSVIESAVRVDKTWTAEKRQGGAGVGVQWRLVRVEGESSGDSSS